MNTGHHAAPRRGGMRTRRAGLPVLAVAMAALACALATAPGVSHANPDPYPHLRGAPNPLRAPGPRSAPRLPLGRSTETRYLELLRGPSGGAAQPMFLGLLGFYRKVISPVNGDQSDVAPVHSLYGVQAIRRHGVLLGSLLTTGRLIQEPDTLRFTPVFRERGRVFHYDPLENHTYWLWEWLR